ncbi:hypothetical protein PLESTB_000968600 [Pleodorina starrii]|uniref:Uncharacterized protein n=1 Tax=Pleodorina starrii TaxID=330485 RepID=A0A9W6F4A6_9CHLO|nr:hypothetical protein PLESTM_001639100 [Pleodorina starrii]GLC55290.1 hypothetical protein PLESTB_000968600 [Pleodorina starrii]GLC70955.1 hypothetical protein PLESTF_001054700 [Pleodorina starrii]
MNTIDEIWRRLTEGRNPQHREIAPGDREGARLYEEFRDCLEQHKRHVFYVVGAVTIPWSYMKKSVGPFVIGSILSLLPDMLYANWRCDDKFRAFAAHCDVLQRAMQQRRRTEGQQGQGQQQGQQLEGQWQQ